MAVTFEPDLLKKAIEIREQVAGESNPFNAFRARFKDVKKVQAGEASELFKQAGLAIAAKKSWLVRRRARVQKLKRGRGPE